jgi:hypothetical protein
MGFQVKSRKFHDQLLNYNYSQKTVVHGISPFKLKPGNGYVPYLKIRVFNGFYIVFV